MESGEHVVRDDPAFVVLEGPARSRGGYVTVVTKAHASVMADLPVGQMGALLAALTRESERLNRTSGGTIQIHAHPSGRRNAQGHLHFRLVPEPLIDGRPQSETKVERSAFASLVETISH